MVHCATLGAKCPGYKHLPQTFLPQRAVQTAAAAVGDLCRRARRDHCRPTPVAALSSPAPPSLTAVNKIKGNCCHRPNPSGQDASTNLLVGYIDVIPSWRHNLIFTGSFTFITRVSGFCSTLCFAFSLSSFSIVLLERAHASVGYLTFTTIFNVFLTP